MLDTSAILTPAYIAMSLVIRMLTAQEFRYRAKHTSKGTTDTNTDTDTYENIFDGRHYQKLVAKGLLQMSVRLCWG